MYSDKFISTFTADRYPTFKDFEAIAKKHNLYFEKVNNEIILAYSGKGDSHLECFNFFKFLFPESSVTLKSFNLISKIQEIHNIFIQNEINRIYKQYDLPPKYNPRVSIHENAISLLNILKFKTAIHKDDLNFIKYILQF